MHGHGQGQWQAQMGKWAKGKGKGKGRATPEAMARVSRGEGRKGKSKGKYFAKGYCYGCCCCYNSAASALSGAHSHPLYCAGGSKIRMHTTFASSFCSSACAILQSQKVMEMGNSISRLSHLTKRCFHCVLLGVPQIIRGGGISVVRSTSCFTLAAH